MPGHMKQTKATMPSCILGEAYQPKVPSFLYIHPGGRGTSVTESRFVADMEVSVPTRAVLCS